MFAFIAIVVFIIIFVQIGHLKTRVKILEDQLHEKGTDNAALPLKTEQSVPAESSVQEAESALPAQDESVPPENVLPDASSAPQRPQPVMAAAVDGGNAAPASSPETACALSQAQEQEKEDASPESSLPSGHSFTLVKTLSWIGGFTLFLGVVFWIKYSIENNLISPAMRVVLSASLGVLLLAAGLIIKRPNLKTTADTLSGVGLTILYAAVYGAYIFYQLLGASGAFILMACIAFLSFGVAIWKQAKYVGFLAQVISFITPFLLSVGSDNALFFFTYVACINIAAAAAMLYAACAWKPQEETGFIACLKGLGGMLLFILMHIEIAVCFSQAESNINLDVFGSFNSAIVYTMGWTVFGASCLLLGWGKEKSFLSKIGWMLIGLALFKLFFSDIWALDGGYRIIGLFGVSIVLIGISFMFQMLRKKS